jgi:RNA polymerase sigma-70 factor (ECF subfamily)
VTDDSAFEALFEAHYDDLLRYALRRVEQPADAADVVGETWTVAWRRRQNLPPLEEHRLWLFGVARRVLANQRRGRLRQSRLATKLREEIVEEWQPEPSADGPVTEALRALAPHDRDVLALSAWEGLRAEEIANVVGCSPAAARVRLHRARRRLRAALAARGYPEDHPKPATLRVAEEHS